MCLLLYDANTIKDFKLKERMVNYFVLQRIDIENYKYVRKEKKNTTFFETEKSLFCIFDL